MSAINIIRQANAVHMLTDGASFDESGAFGFMGVKAWPLPHLNAVLAARGPKILPTIAVETLTAAGQTYDEVKASLAFLLRETVPVWADILRHAPTGGDFEIVVAGWSETKGPDSYIICSHSHYAGVEPWTAVQLGPFAPAPGVDDIVRAFWAEAPDVYDVEDLDPETHGLKLLECQRRYRDPALGHSVVGGFAQLTTVTREAITTRVIHKWPDKPGDRLAA